MAAGIAPASVALQPEALAADRSDEPRALALVCVETRRETADVLTLVFAAADRSAIPHAPGQAVTLAVPVAGEILHRTFTISGASRARDRIAVTVKAHPHGRATPWLHAHAAPGLALAARGPHGSFTLARREGADRAVAFVSAGSGATPMIAMLRALAEDAPETRALWVHVARTPDDVLFGAEVARLQETMPRLEARVVVTSPRPGWFGFAGRISRRLLSVVAPDLARRDVFACGPEGFMQALRLIHAAEGGDPARLHTERFGPASAPSEEASRETAREAGPDASPAFTVRLGAKVFSTAPGETLMQAAARQAVVIPCGCGQGLCGTCRVRLEEGTVAMRHKGGLSAREEAEGYVLACSARATSDLHLSF